MLILLQGQIFYLAVARGQVLLLDQAPVPDIAQELAVVEGQGVILDQGLVANRRVYRRGGGTALEIHPGAKVGVLPGAGMFAVQAVRDLDTVAEVETCLVDLIK